MVRYSSFHSFTTDNTYQNLTKPDTQQNDIKTFRSYRTENTLRLRYQDQRVKIL